MIPDLPGPIQHCPWCGEAVGSFWGRTEAGGASWCERCQHFFEARVLEDDPPAAEPGPRPID